MALNDNYEKVLLYGKVTDHAYFEEFIKPLMENIVICDHEDDKNKMYNSVDAVYHTSKFETYGLVEAECKLAKVPFNGNKNNPKVISDKEILKKWESVII